MAKVNRVDWNVIKQDYIDNHNEIQLKDLAAKYGVKPATLRSRKNREKWDDELSGVATSNATQRKNVATKKRKSNKNTSSEQQKKDITLDDIKNKNLTDKQQLFCVYYVKYWNATKAYQKAYKSSYKVANVEGCRLLVNPSVKTEIDRLKQGIQESIKLDQMAIIQKYIDIAFADITDYVTFGTKEVPVVVGKGEDKEIVMRQVNYVDLEDSENIDGTLITEVKKGRDGVTLKLADRSKALEMIGKHLGMFKDVKEITGKDGGPIVFQTWADMQLGDTDEETTENDGESANS